MSWTLRAKNSLASARVVADEGGDGKGDQEGTHDTGKAAGDDREADAGQRCEDARLDVSERGGRGNLRELDPGDPPAVVSGRHRPQNRPSEARADVVRSSGRREEQEREPERGREAE